MNRITWKGDHFECSSSELEDAKFEALWTNNKCLHEFMEACDLPMNGYSYDAERNIEIHRKTGQGNVAFFPIAKEGTGFNICFHLGAYAIASMDLGQKLEICAYSFKALLHPVLFQGLSKWFGDRKVEEIDKKCPYYSGSYELKCAVNPSLPCKDCSDASVSFNENLFVWKVADSNDYLNYDLMKRLEDATIRRSGLESMRQAFMTVQDSTQSFSRITIPRFDMGVDKGSGQNATVIATAFTNADGSTRIESLEVCASTSEGYIETARSRACDRDFLEASQWVLSDRIKPLTPLPSRLKESEWESAAIATRKRIWSQFSGMQIQPQPRRMPIPQELYGVLEDKTND